MVIKSTVSLSDQLTAVKNLIDAGGSVSCVSRATARAGRNEPVALILSLLTQSNGGRAARVTVVQGTNEEIGSLLPKNTERWMELCQQAPTEQDSQK